MSRLLNSAIQYSQWGLSVIPTNIQKQSLVKWSTFQEHSPCGKQLSKMFNHPSAHCIAVITGEISGNLEVIDIDTKNDLEGTLLEKLLRKLKELDPDLIKIMVIASSRSGGYHLYYRCPKIDRNLVLARRSVTEEELTRNPKEKVKVLIETRGQGGYIIVPPSPGYRFLQRDFKQIPNLSFEQREILLIAARSCNQYQELKPRHIHAPRIRSEGQLSPLDDYNRRGNIVELFQHHGWTVVHQTEKRTYFKRPGDTDKLSSGDFNHELNYFSVFSTSTEFEPGKGYMPYAVYAMLECHGDFGEAVRKLAKQGYGSPTNNQKCKGKKL